MVTERWNVRLHPRHPRVLTARTFQATAKTYRPFVLRAFQCQTRIGIFRAHDHFLLGDIERLE
jgi:hypothetical protein